MRVLALTGVPGTGKTTVAERVEGVATVDANELARRVGAIEGRDEGREAAVVDEQLLWERAREGLPGEPALVEGHLAHHCDPDAVLLLRCHPDELERRLEARGWPRAKVDENVLAETLDALVPEIATEPAREVDATEADPDDLAARITGLFTGDPLKAAWSMPLGSVDWTAEFAREEER